MKQTSKRLEKELAALQSKPPEGVKFVSATSKAEGLVVDVELSGAANTLYAGETFRLRMICGDKYPFESPSVYFVVGDGFKPPVHHHIYSNGHICLSILGTEWTPALQLSSVALSVLSMLSSAAFRSLPPGDASYSRQHPFGSDPKKTKFSYDDDNV
jgi:ubiquitin-conjugating enzyme E2 W